MKHLLATLTTYLAALLAAILVVATVLELALRLGGGDPLATALLVIGIAGACGWLADWRRST